MSTKLTLRLDSTLISQAKNRARHEGKSLSQMVADYFRAIEPASDPKTVKVGAITAQLQGCLKGSALDERDFNKHLEDKYL
jgi:hypothetical protein